MNEDLQIIETLRGDVLEDSYELRMALMRIKKQDYKLFIELWQGLLLQHRELIAADREVSSVLISDVIDNLDLMNLDEEHMRLIVSNPDINKILFEENPDDLMYLEELYSHITYYESADLLKIMLEQIRANRHNEESFFELLNTVWNTSWKADEDADKIAVCRSFISEIEDDEDRKECDSAFEENLTFWSED